MPPGAGEGSVAKGAAYSLDSTEAEIVRLKEVIKAGSVLQNDVLLQPHEERCRWPFSATGVVTLGQRSTPSSSRHTFAETPARLTGALPGQFS